MFNFFNSNVFIEIGEAIGNVGSKVFKRKRGDAELVDSIFQRRLSEGRGMALPLGEMHWGRCDEEAIEAEFRILSEKEDQ